MTEKEYTFTYERNVSTSYLVAETDCEEAVKNYEIEMITNNPSSNIIPLYLRRKDNTLKIYYNITSKVSLQWLLERKELKKNEFIGILCGIAKPLIEASGYFLKESSFIIDERYIFVSPDLTEISLVYLPVSLNSDYLKGYRELVLKLITELADIVESPGDNYLQRILGSVKQEGFNIIDFDRLLKELSCSGIGQDMGTMPEAAPINDRHEFLLIPASEASGKFSKNKEINNPVKGNRTNKPMIIGILSQMVLIFLLIVLFKSQIIRNTTGTDSTSTYLGLLLVVGAIDFLILRSILSNHKKIEKSEGDNTKGADIKNSLPYQKKTNKTKNSVDTGYGLSGNKAVKRSNTEDIKREMSPEKGLQNIIKNSCETEFLGSIKDFTPYLRGANEGAAGKIPIKKDRFIIGRLKEQVDYACDNIAIGKLHAEITTKAGEYYIKDLNSRNGTFINSDRIDSNKEYNIKNNDRISLANSDYIFIIP